MNLEVRARDWNANARLIYRAYGAPALVACQRCTERNLVYRVYYPAFYARRSVGATYRECCLVNQRCKLPPRPKKLCKSRAGRGKCRGLGGAAPPFIGSKMGGKKGGRGRRGTRGTRGTRLVST